MEARRCPQPLVCPAPRRGRAGIAAHPNRSGSRRRQPASPPGPEALGRDRGPCAFSGFRPWPGSALASYPELTEISGAERPWNGMRLTGAVVSQRNPRRRWHGGAGGFPAPPGLRGSCDAARTTNIGQ